MRIDAWLGIETTGDTGGVALVREGRVLAETSFTVMGASAERLLPGIGDLFRAAGLPQGAVEGVAVSSGPGSYTGLRVGIATAQGLAAGWGVGLKGVGTLHALARCTGSPGPVLTCIRARKGEVFACLFRDGGEDPAPLTPAGVFTVPAMAALVAEHPGVLCVGSGCRELAALPGLVPHLPVVEVPPAREVAFAGRLLTSRYGFDAAVRPAYLRGFMERASDAVP